MGTASPKLGSVFRIKKSPVRGFFNGYFSRKVIRHLVKSYGLSSVRTLSPSRIWILFWRILPLICPNTTISFSSLTRNIELGRASSTTPIISIKSSFDTLLLLSFLQFLACYKSAESQKARKAQTISTILILCNCISTYFNHLSIYSAGPKLITILITKSGSNIDFN